MKDVKTFPRLTLAHTTRAARNLDRLTTFYCDVLGFCVTNRGKTPNGGEIVVKALEEG